MSNMQLGLLVHVRVALPSQQPSLQCLRSGGLDFEILEFNQHKSSFVKCMLSLALTFESGDFAISGRFCWETAVEDLVLFAVLYVLP